MFGAILLAGQFVCAATEIDIDLPRRDGVLKWNAKERQFSGAFESAPLKHVMSKVAGVTGWTVLVDPAAEQITTAQFTNRASGDALRLMLGGLSFAVVPQKEGSSKLLVFRKDVKEATEKVEPAKVDPKHGKDWIKNEVLVTLTRGSKRDIDALAKMLGAKIVGRNDKLRSYRLQFDSEESADNARNQLATAPDLRADDNFYVHQPLDPTQPQTEGPVPFNLNPVANADGSQTIVAVVDTAVQSLSPEKSAFLLPAVNVAGDGKGLPGDIPLHGTSMVETLFGSMAITAGGEGNSSVRILPVNVYGTGEATSTYEVAMGLAEALRYNPRVVNLSLGGDGDSSLLDDLIAVGNNRGVLFFAAAGNTPTTEPTYPAANPMVFAVTAGDRNGNLAPYANRGPFIDMIAPGTSYMDFNGTTYRVTGTSPATATVSGAAISYLAEGLPREDTILRLRQMFGMQNRAR